MKTITINPGNKVGNISIIESETKNSGEIPDSIFCMAVFPKKDKIFFENIYREMVYPTRIFEYSNGSFNY